MTADTNPTKDIIPPRWRLAFQVAAAVTGPAIFITAGTLAIWVPDRAAQFNETAVLLSSGLATIAGSLGIAYNPYRSVG